MNAMDLGHLSDDELQRFSMYYLPLDEATTAYGHMRGCADCNSRYRELTTHLTNANPAPELTGTGDQSTAL